jgi:thymidylate kinase
METLENQKKVREVYLKFVEDGKLVKVDGNRSISKVATEILNLVLNRLKKD